MCIKGGLLMGLEKINEFKRQKGLTNLQLSQMTGITVSTIDKITSGNNTNPKLRTIEALCEAVGCSLNDLVDTYDESNIDNQITSDELSHIKKYRTLDEYGKEAVDGVLNVEYKRCAADSKPETIKVFTAARSIDGQTPMGYEEMTKEEYEELINAPETDEDF